LDILKSIFKWIWGRIVAYYRWRKKRHQIILERRRAKGLVRDWLETIVTVAIMVLVIRVTVVEAFRIPTSSMEDTLLVGDFLLVNKFIYGIRTPDWIGVPFTKIGFSVPSYRFPALAKPKQGDIIVFRYPLDPRVNYIKRCIATEGQTVEIHNKVLFVDGKPFPKPPKSKFVDARIFPSSIQERGIFPYGAGNRDNYGPVKVPAGNYFMMGDNRDNSLDSRYWGFLPKKNIVGKAAIIYFSWDKYAPLYRFTKKIRWTRITNLIK
jgi:signal peptidase I